MGRLGRGGRSRGLSLSAFVFPGAAEVIVPMEQLVRGAPGAGELDPALGVVLPGAHGAFGHPAMAPAAPPGRWRRVAIAVGSREALVPRPDPVGVVSSEGRCVTELLLPVDLAVPPVARGDCLGAGHADSVGVLPATVVRLLLGLAFPGGPFRSFGDCGLAGSSGVSRFAVDAFSIRAAWCVWASWSSAHGRIPQ